MISKIVIVLFLIAIVWCLFSAFYFLMRDKGEGDRVVWRLTWRIGLSMVLFLMLYGAFLLGWIEPSTPGPIGLLEQSQGQGGGN